VVVRGEHQTARMSLNPAHLGPIEIQLRMQDDQAQLWLTAQHPQAREALESAMPRLREMFAQQGIDLSQQGASGQPRDQRAGSSAPWPELATATDSAGAGPESGTGHGHGQGADRLLDDYA
jgi:flagellar hook-length control protein FliK